MGFNSEFKGLINMESESLRQFDFSDFNVAFLVVNAGIFQRGTITDVQLLYITVYFNVIIILIFNCTPINYFPINVKLSIKISLQHSLTVYSSRFTVNANIFINRSYTENLRALKIYMSNALY